MRLVFQFSMLILVHGIRTTTHLILYCHSPEHVLSVAVWFQTYCNVHSVSWCIHQVLHDMFLYWLSLHRARSCRWCLDMWRKSLWTKEERVEMCGYKPPVACEYCTIKMIVKSVIIPWCMWATLSIAFGVNRGVSPRYVELWITFSFHPNTNFTLALTIITVQTIG